jgi:hypothetical protein
MANPNQKLAVGLTIRRRLAPPLEVVMADQSYASVTTNQGIKNLNTLKRRRGIWPMLVQQEEDLR